MLLFDATYSRKKDLRISREKDMRSIKSLLPLCLQIDLQIDQMIEMFFKIATYFQLFLKLKKKE